MIRHVRKQDLNVSKYLTAGQSESVVGALYPEYGKRIKGRRCSALWISALG
jgi:hypothetical protein